MTGNSIPSLYIHVPFCVHICHYCDFRRRVYRNETADRWLEALKSEISAFPVETLLETIYIGGGTPSCLSNRQLNLLFELLKPYTERCREFTIECNPELNDPEKINLFREYGVNRISMGLQTHDSRLLNKLNRHHTFEDAKRLCDQLREAGIANISIDLMYGLPDQDRTSLSQSIDAALSLNPYHMSLYSLTIEENSVFGKKGVKPADEDLEADMYEDLCERLCREGFIHYEISNFALPGYASVHNTNTWKYRYFHGFGFGAWGMDDKGRYEHAGTLNEYLEHPRDRFYTRLSEKEQMFEMIMMGLRLKDGISENEFHRRFGVEIHDVYPKCIHSFNAQGLLLEQKNRLMCTEYGWRILNTLLTGFLEEADL